MKTIHLPTDHVQFDELAHLIVSALHPLSDDSTDSAMLTHGCARINLEAELIKAVNTGALPVKDPLTFGPHTYPVGHALQTSLVAANDLRDFLAGRGLVVEVAEPQLAPVKGTATPAHLVTGAKKWTPEKLAELKAYREAHTMPQTADKFGISEQRIRQLLPSPKPHKAASGMYRQLLK